MKIKSHGMEFSFCEGVYCYNEGSIVQAMVENLLLAITHNAASHVLKAVTPFTDSCLH